MRSLDSTPNNLPLQLTSFVGREHDLDSVHKLLAQARLLTLVGPGGIGKTRLSLQAASGLLDEYPGGVWFVELAPLSDARLVPQAVASVLGVREDAGRSFVDAIKAFANGRQMLLVLDNCEHVIGPCSELVAQLLSSTASLSVLASSREPLRVPGETTYTVPPLSMPTGNAMLTVATLSQYEATRLSSIACLPSNPVLNSRIEAHWPRPTSAGASTGFRWRSSWLPCTHASSRRRKSPSD